MEISEVIVNQLMMRSSWLPFANTEKFRLSSPHSLSQWEFGNQEMERTQWEGSKVRLLTRTERFFP